MDIKVISIGEVFECNVFKKGVKDILIDCVVEGVEGDECKAWVSAYGDGEHFNLDIVRNGCEAESYDFTEEQVEDILNKAKTMFFRDGSL